MKGEKEMETVKLAALTAVNDIGKPWRYEEDGLTVTRSPPHVEDYQALPLRNLFLTLYVTIYERRKRWKLPKLLNWTL
jgi:hypothetical protein